MKATILCFGRCDDVPDEVCDAVLARLKRIPGGDGDECDDRAAGLANHLERKEAQASAA